MNAPVAKQQAGGIAEQSEAFASYLEQLLGDETEQHEPPQAGRPEPIAAVQPGDEISACLLDIGSIKLAVPEQNIAKILEPGQDIWPTEETNGESWLIGEIQHEDNRISVVDVEKLIKGQSQYAGQASGVLLLANSEWGLLYYHCQSGLSIHADQPRWREDLTSSPWLTATIKEHLCALLEPATLIAWLEQAATK